MSYVLLDLTELSSYPPLVSSFEFGNFDFYQKHPPFLCLTLGMPLLV